MIRSLTITFGLVLGLAVASAPPLSWPDTDAAKHARAWFEAFNAGESAMRAVYQEHYSPDALAQRSVETRLGGYRDMKSQQGSLTPIAIPQAEDSRIQVVARNARGETITLGFECQTVAPHRIEGIRVMMGEGGPGGGPAGAGSAAGPPLDDPAAVEAMQTILTQAAAVDSFSGAVLLARDGKPLLRQAWNQAERRFAVANQPETRFNLGSVNKLFTKVAIAQLA